MDMYQKRKIRAEKKKDDSKKSLPSVGINWYPGHMAKTKREIKEKIDLIDIVFEVIDARIPYSSKNKDIDNIINNKEKIIIMTKMDLCDLEVTNKWIKHYENMGYKVILTDLLSKKNIKDIFNLTEELSTKLNQKRKEKGLLPRKTRILVLGIPNVGKSTLINALVGKKATNVGNKPGITKHLEWIRINDKMELLDSPGILWPKLDNETVALNLASTTAIKEEILDTSAVAIYIINKMLELYPENIISRYNINKEDDIVDTLDKIGKKIGAYKNGECDYDRVYITILKDLREGYLGKITFDRIKE